MQLNVSRQAKNFVINKGASSIVVSVINVEITFANACISAPLLESSSSKGAEILAKGF